MHFLRKRDFYKPQRFGISLFTNQEGLLDVFNECAFIMTMESLALLVFLIKYDPILDLGLRLVGLESTGKVSKYFFEKVTSTDNELFFELCNELFLKN